MVSKNVKIGLGVIVIAVLVLVLVPGLINGLVSLLTQPEHCNVNWPAQASLDPACFCDSGEEKKSFVWLGGISRYYCAPGTGWFLDPADPDFDSKAIAHAKTILNGDPTTSTCTSIPCDVAYGSISASPGQHQGGREFAYVVCQTNPPPGYLWEVLFWLDDGSIFSPGGNYPYCVNHL